MSNSSNSSNSSNPSNPSNALLKLNNLIKKSSSDSPSPGNALQSKLSAQKKRAQSFYSAKQCLLLDVSGSMSDYICEGERSSERNSNSPSSPPPIQRKIDALRDLAGEFPRTRKFCFSSDCKEIYPGEQISEPHGGTNLAGALRGLKAQEILHAILITDGQPDNEQAAYNAAEGMKLDLFYVGDLPAPKFMAELARRTGGEFGTSSMAKGEEQKKLTRTITALLEYK